MIRVGAVKTEFDGDYVHLYIWDDDGHTGKALLVWEDAATPSRTPVPEGQRAPRPSLILPRDVWEAIKATVTRDLADRDALAEHLRDTINVRDRLLTIVERP